MTAATIGSEIVQEAPRFASSVIGHREICDWETKYETTQVLVGRGPAR